MFFKIITSQPTRVARGLLLKLSDINKPILYITKEGFNTKLTYSRNVTVIQVGYMGRLRYEFNQPIVVLDHLHHSQAERILDKFKINGDVVMVMENVLQDQITQEVIGELYNQELTNLFV